MTRADATVRQNELYAEVKRLSAILGAFPKGPMNLTPDHIKASPEYRAAKANYNTAFARLRAFNTAFVKTYR